MSWHSRVRRGRRLGVAVALRDARHLLRRLQLVIGGRGDDAVAADVEVVVAAPPAAAALEPREAAAEEAARPPSLGEAVSYRVV